MSPLTAIVKEIVIAVLIDVLVFATTVVGVILVVAVVATEVLELDEQAPIKIAVTNAFINRRKKYFLIRLAGRAQVCLATHQ